MFHRIARYCGPLALRSNRTFCSRRTIPVVLDRSPWNRGLRARNFDDFFRPAFPMRNWMQEMEREFDDMMGHLNRSFEPGRHGVQVTCNKSLFEVRMDINEFKPEELQIKLTDNNSRLQVSAKHEQKEDDHGFVTRQIQREFQLPENVDLDTLKSTISEDGILTIKADVKFSEKEVEIKIDKSSQ